MQAKIMAVDPGETCGVALVGWNDETCELGGLQTENVKWSDWSRLYALVRVLRPDVVICENFRLFPHKAKEQTGSVFPTVKVIGVLEYLCWSCDIDFVFQEPAIKMVYSDGRLKRCGLYQPGKPHVNDAIRHLLWYCLKGKHYARS